MWALAIPSDLHCCLLIQYCSYLGSQCSPRSDNTWQKTGNDDCCSNGIAGSCGEGDGDCDDDSECAGSLVCGTDNCPWGDGDDCCEQPGMHRTKLVKTQLPNIRCFSPNRLFRPIFLYRLKFQFSTAMPLFRFWCFEFD